MARDLRTSSLARRRHPNIHLSFIPPDLGAAGPSGLTRCWLSEDVWRRKGTSVVALFLFLGAPALRAQQSEQEAAKKGDGYALPDSDRLRISVQLAAGYGVDEAENSRLGFEAQGRVGWAIVSLFGKLGDHFSYRLEVNPVNESSPLPACGTPTFFYPNAAQNIGPNVRCENGGDKRVDDYKFIALDPLSQQGPIRQAYVDYQSGWFGLRFGRFILPLGFGWQEAGSFTAKDATHIQRLDAEANFGLQSAFAKKRADGSQLAVLYLAAVVGDGSRNHDYDYFYFADPSLDSNSALTGVLSGSIRPFRGLEVRAAYKHGHTGSKVEYFPNYFADKHNDFATLLSAEWRPVRFGRVFGEYARYVWGPTETSAMLVGADPAPIRKDGYYAGGEVKYPLTEWLNLGANVTREELSRDDSLVKYLAARSLYDVEMGNKERDTVLRFRADIGRYIAVGVYRMWLDNPFPQASGIAAVEGPGAYQGWGSNRWGFVLLAHLP